MTTTEEKIAVHEAGLKDLNWNVAYHTRMLQENLIKLGVAETYIAHLKTQLIAEQKEESLVSE